MAAEISHTESTRAVTWPWRIGLVVETPSLVAELGVVLAESNATCVFQTAASTPVFDVAHLVEREKPELIFVEFAAAPGGAAEWIEAVRSGDDLPLVIAIHPTAEPDEMIAALRAGANEFLCLPVRPAIFEAIDRIGALLESRHAANRQPGQVGGLLSAKGGCGATTLACFLACALQASAGSGKVLIADLDHQAPAARRVCGSKSTGRLAEAFHSVRRLNSGCWPEFIVSATENVDLIGSEPSDDPGNACAPEPWRIDGLFRFLTRRYGWILADLGRQLNPVNWEFLHSLDRLFIVTAPDVLALYQTRAILQTLSSRGYDRARVRLILNRNQVSPQDFWVESIEKMFEMPVYSVIPHEVTLPTRAGEPLALAANSAYGRAVLKMANLMRKAA